MALALARPAAGARAYPARRCAPVRRGRCAALVAAAQRPGRAHAHLRRSRLAAVRHRALCGSSPAIAPILDEQMPFLEGRRCRASEHDAFFEPGVSEQTRDAFRALRARPGASLRLGAHGLPLIGTGDWNDGMNRVGEHGRGESVWLGWFLHATLDAFAPHRRGARRTARAPRLAAATPRGCATRSNSRPGTANGIAAAISTTARRSARPAAMNAASTRSRSPGRDLRRRESGARAARDGGARRAADATRSDARPAVHAAFRQVAAGAWLRQGLSAAAFARTAASTPTPRCGRRSRSPCRARRRGRGAVRHAEPDQSRDARVPMCSVTRWSPMSSPPTSIREAPHVGRGGWTWYTGSAGWLYRAGLEWILGFRLHENRVTLSPCVPPDWSGFSILYRHRSRLTNSLSTGSLVPARAAVHYRWRSAARRDAPRSSLSMTARLTPCVSAG